MYCSGCGTPNADQARFCEKCGVPLAAAPAPGNVAVAPVAPLPPPVAPPNVLPQQRLAWQAPQQPGPYADPRLRAGAGYPNAPYWNPGDGKRYAVGKSPVAAVLLSLFLPAIGQFYNGDVKKGLLMWAGYLVGTVLAFFYIGSLIIFGVWIWSMIDANSVANRRTPLW